jgi:hypothetical protein
MSESKYLQAAYEVFDYVMDRQDAGKPLYSETIANIIEKNTVPDTAWRDAFAHFAKELGCETRMTHCSESVFPILKRIQELLQAEKDCATYRQRLEKALKTIDELNQAAIDEDLI